ncbi:PilZ domain-containing protein [Bermanella sp. R86510]|uniref:PilZ domain-containing protein n=1 Tax=unclassified Bermanella TaxID=2627862 RepID=UPI0037C8C0F5
MNLAKAYEEKRDFIRMRVESPLTLTVNGREIQCLCVDLSGTGMCIETTETLAIDDEAIAFLPSYQNKFAPLHARVIIRRVLKDKSVNSYGAEIVELLS